MIDYLQTIVIGKRKGLIPGLVRFVLLLLSFVYGIAVRVLILLNRFFAVRLPCKVISIGNITTGGTGKTTLVAAVATYLQVKGQRVAILSRGYKKNCVSCCGAEPEAQTMGDEPQMLAQKLKGISVIVDANRIRGARKAIREGADTLVLDDGFQQWRLHKDIEIVVIDATNPFSNRHMLPAGMLREPLSSLRRADVFVISKADAAAGGKEARDVLERINPRAAIFEAQHTAAGCFDMRDTSCNVKIDELKTKPVALFCGIGDPASFENTVRSLGIQIGLSLRFRDHHNYTQADFEEISTGAGEKNIDTLLTTEKDAARISVKLLEKLRQRVLVLRVAITFQDEKGFFNRLR